MIRILTLAAAAIALAAPAFAQPGDTADFVARHAAENGEQQTARFIERGGFDGSYTTFGDADGSISALEVALRHAVETDDRQLAKHLRARLAGAEQDGMTAVAGTKNVPSVSALEVALRHAEESDDRQRAAYLRAQLGE